MPGRGLKRSTPHRVAHRLGATLHPAIFAALAAPLPASGQVRDATRKDQGETETCHAHSAISCVEVVTGKIGSPQLLASCVAADVRAAKTPPGDPLPPLTDDGAELQDDADALRRWGLGQMGPQIAGRSGLSDVPDDVPGVPFAEPNVAALETAGHTLITGEYSIPVDANAPKTVAACIVAGIPVWLGTLVGASFQSLLSDEVAQPTPDTDPTAGGHAMYISGYRTATDGTYEFRVENSWGTGWADGGACWASTAWLLACWDLWPFPAVST